MKKGSILILTLAAMAPESCSCPMHPAMYETSYASSELQERGRAAFHEYLTWKGYYWDRNLDPCREEPGFLELTNGPVIKDSWICEIFLRKSIDGVVYFIQPSVLPGQPFDSQSILDFKVEGEEFLSEELGMNVEIRMVDLATYPD